MVPRVTETALAVMAMPRKEVCLRHEIYTTWPKVCEHLTCLAYTLGGYALQSWKRHVHVSTPGRLSQQSLTSLMHLWGFLTISAKSGLQNLEDGLRRRSGIKRSAVY